MTPPTPGCVTPGPARRSTPDCDRERKPHEQARPDRQRTGQLGVWYADDPVQVPWQRFLDEVTGAGYTRIELGPYGYLPSDPSRLRDELDQRGLTVTAGTIFEHLHRKDSWESTWAGVSAVAELTAAMGAKHVVVIPDF